MNLWFSTTGWAPSWVCTYVSGGWYQLGKWGWSGHESRTSSLGPHQLVLLAGLPRAARGQGPKSTSTFQSSACVLFAITQLVEASHMTVSVISVGGAWTRAQTRRKRWASAFGKLLDCMRYRRLWREAREFLVDTCTPGPEQNKWRALKVREPRKKMAALHYWRSL